MKNAPPSDRLDFEPTLEPLLLTQILHLEYIDKAISGAEKSGFTATASSLRVIWARDFDIVAKSILQQQATQLFLVRGDFDQNFDAK